MASISSLIQLIRQAVKGLDVRDTIANGIEAINEEVEATTERQDDLEATFENLIINAGSSNAEIVAARHDNITNENHATVGARLDKVSEGLADMVYYVDTNAGDGSVDSTTSLQSSLDNAIGKTIVIPRGNYKISSTLNVPDNTTIIAYGSKIFNTTDSINLLKVGNGVKIYGLELVGKGNVTANTNNVGIVIEGINTNYVENITIEDCNIRDFGGYGIRTNYAKGVIIKKALISNIGYSGVGVFSSDYVKVDNCRIKNISPGVNSKTYGVFFSRVEDDNLVLYPKSKHCTVTNCIIEDNPIWEGLDTHGAENVIFSGNIIKNCKVGISIAGSDNSLGETIFNSIYCEANNNTIYGIGGGFGIVVTGSIENGTIYYAEACGISNNRLINCGENGNNISGGIKIALSRSCTVIGNKLKNSYANGIVITSDNAMFSVIGNTVLDVQDSAYTVPGGIAVRSNNNTGVISGNALLSIDNTLNTYVSVRGISMTGEGNSVSIANNENNFSTPYNGLDSTRMSYATFGSNNVKMFAGVNSPEGVVTASVGSLFIRTNGGAATTLYVKENGTGNTGWVAK